MSRTKNGRNKFLHALREKHTGRDEELSELAQKAAAHDALQCMLRDEMLSAEGLEQFHGVIGCNPTIARGDRQLQDRKNFPPGSARRRSMRLNCLHKEMKLIAGMDVSDEDREILQDLAKVRWGFISMDHIKDLEVGSEEYHTVMSNRHADVQGEMRIQSLWNIADVTILGFAGVMALSVLFDGGLTLATVVEAGLWGGAGYAGHKAIQNRDVLLARFQDFASNHGMSKLQARKAYANGTAGTE